MLEIEEKLSKGGEAYKNELLESLHSEGQSMKERMDKGVSPDEYNTLTKYIATIETSIAVLKTYNAI